MAPAVVVVAVVADAALHSFHAASTSFVMDASNIPHPPQPSSTLVRVRVGLGLKRNPNQKIKDSCTI